MTYQLVGAEQAGVEVALVREAAQGGQLGCVCLFVFMCRW